MSKPLDQTDNAGLKTLERDLLEQLKQYRDAGLKLDLTRGKPGPEQLSLSDALDGILQGNYRDSTGTDLRNYGGLDGIPEARTLFAEMLGVELSELATDTIMGMREVADQIGLGMTDTVQDQS